MGLPHQHLRSIPGRIPEACSCNSLVPSYICSSCHTLFCQNCAKLIGIPASCICKVCGCLCTGYAEFLQKQSVRADQATPFGVEDLKAALHFPLYNFFANLLLALVYGALLYSIPYLGFSGVGVLFGLLGVIPALIANSFMLGLGLRVINAVGSRRLNSTNVIDASETLADLGETVALSCAILLIVSAPLLISLLFAPDVPLIHWLSLGWAIFYYPLALSVAASSNSFWSTINPLDGLEVIRTHKTIYPKFFLLYVLICAIAGGLVIGAFVKFLQAISNSPGIVLLPIFIALMMILGSVVFYSNLVISFLLGRMLFKESY